MPDDAAAVPAVRSHETPSAGITPPLQGYGLVPTILDASIGAHAPRPSRRGARLVRSPAAEPPGPPTSRRRGQPHAVHDRGDRRSTPARSRPHTRGTSCAVQAQLRSGSALPNTTSAGPLPLRRPHRKSQGHQLRPVDGPPDGGLPHVALRFGSASTYPLRAVEYPTSAVSPALVHMDTRVSWSKCKGVRKMRQCCLRYRDQEEFTQRVEASRLNSPQR